MLNLADILQESETDVLRSSGVFERILEVFEEIVELRYLVMNKSGEILDGSSDLTVGDLPSALFEHQGHGPDPVLLPHGKGCLYTRTHIKVPPDLEWIAFFHLKADASLRRLADLGHILNTQTQSFAREFCMRRENRKLSTRIDQYRSEKQHLQMRYEQIAMENLRVRQELELANQAIEQDRQLTKERFQSLFSSAPIAQVLVQLTRCRNWLNTHNTPQGQPFPHESLPGLMEILHANEAACSLFGVQSFPEFLQFWLHQLHAQSRRKLGQFLQQLLTEGSQQTLQLSLQNQNGGQHEVLIQFGKLDEDGMTRCMSLVDLTDRIQMERGLVDAKSQAEIANRAKSEFLAVISHELRTPLNGIMGFASLLADSGLEEQQQHYLNFIQQSGNQLYAVVSDILDFVRLETGDFLFEPSWFRLRSTLDTLIDEFLPLAQQKNLTLQLRLHPGVPDEVELDKDILLKILRALISNAIKFTFEGSVQIQGKVLDTDAGQSLVLSVVDTGTGIPAETVDKLFHPFTQADSSSTRSADGIGMGLTLSHRLAELAKARLNVQSKPGKGSTFQVEFPIHAFEQTTSKPSTHDLSGLKVLIAEDSSTNSAVLEQMLHRIGVPHVDWCKNGQELILLAQKKEYDLIMTDVYMPVMGGIEACKAIREYEQSTGKTAAVIVAVSASVTMRTQRKCLEAGADTFLSKPLHQNQLHELLNDIDEQLKSDQKSIK